MCLPARYTANEMVSFATFDWTIRLAVICAGPFTIIVASMLGTTDQPDAGAFVVAGMPPPIICACVKSADCEADVSTLESGVWVIAISGICHIMRRVPVDR